MDDIAVLMGCQPLHKWFSPKQGYVLLWPQRAKASQEESRRGKVGKRKARKGKKGKEKAGKGEAGKGKAGNGNRGKRYICQREAGKGGMNQGGVKDINI